MIRSLAGFYKAVAFLALTLSLMPVQWVLLKLDHPYAEILPHHYHRLLCKILGVKISVEGAVQLSGLVVANHVSWLDIPVLSTLHPVSFVTKKEVAAWPLFGTMARLQRCIFIDRQNRAASAAAGDVLASALHAGKTIVLFPEGTSNSGRSLKPFKSSFFACALQAECLVYPVCLVYRGQHGLPLTLRQRPRIAWYGDMELLPHLWDYLKSGPCHVQVVIGAPLNPKSFTDRKALAAEAEQRIREALAGEFQTALT